MRNLSRSEHLAAWLCGAGILLGSAGLWAMRYFPLTPQEQENERLLQEVHIPAAERFVQKNPENPAAQGVLEELRKSSVFDQKPAPYRAPGTLVLVVGMSLFLVGVFLWFQARRRRASRWVKENEDV